MNKKLLLIASGLLCSAVFAKIPTPVLSDEAKAKAAEAAAKTAWAGKTEAYLLCKYQDRAAANHLKTAKAAGKDVKPAKDTPACADPGAFVYAPAAAGAPAAAATPAAAAATAAAKPAAPATGTAPAAAPAKKS